MENFPGTVYVMAIPLWCQVSLKHLDLILKPLLKTVFVRKGYEKYMIFILGLKQKKRKMPRCSLIHQRMQKSMWAFITKK